MGFRHRTRAPINNGRPVLVSGLLHEVPMDRECATLEGVAPKVCGVLGAFGLSAESFHDYIADTVPVNDASR